MPIATYSDLQSAVGDWLNRADLTSVIPNFITLAEAKFNRNLRVRDMLKRAEATSSNEFVALPSDFLQDYSLELDMAGLSARASLSYIGVDEAKILKANKATGPVRSYTIVDGAIELLPAPGDDVSIILTYYGKIAALSGTNASNWLLAKAPDLYLYSALLEAAPYLKDDMRIQLWGSAQKQILDDMALESERSMRSSTRLVARKRTF